MHGRPLIFVSEPDEVQAQAPKIWEQVQSSYAEAVEKGQRAAPPDTLVIDWETAAAWLESATALESLALSEDEPAGTSPVSRRLSSPAGCRIG